MEKRTFRNKAFLSYRHVKRDGKLAALLQEKLEHYRISRGLQGGRIRSRGVGRIFRDTTDLGARADLTEELRRELDESEYLIVLCSEAAIGSKWIEREIRYFLQSHNVDRILPVLADGEPEEVLPALFSGIEGMPQHPVACDFRGNRRQALREELPRLAAALLDCPYDELINRRHRFETRRMAAVTAGMILLLSAVIAYYAAMSAQTRRSLREKQIGESESLAVQSETALSQRLRLDAVRYALSALPVEEGDRPVIGQAMLALQKATAAYVPEENRSITQTGELKASGRITAFQAREISGEIYVSASCGDSDTVLWNADTGKTILDTSVEPGIFDFQKKSDWSSIKRQLLAQDQLLISVDGRLMGRDVRSGEIRWQVKEENTEHFEIYDAANGIALVLAMISEPAGTAPDGTDWHNIVQELQIRSLEDGKILRCLKNNQYPDRDIINASFDGGRVFLLERENASAEDPDLSGGSSEAEEGGTAEEAIESGKGETGQKTCLSVLDVKTGEKKTLLRRFHITDFQMTAGGRVLAAYFKKPNRKAGTKVTIGDPDEDGYETCFFDAGEEIIRFCSIDTETGETVWEAGSGSMLECQPLLLPDLHILGREACLLSVGTHVEILAQDSGEKLYSVDFPGIPVYLKTAKAWGQEVLNAVLQDGSQASYLFTSGELLKKDKVFPPSVSEVREAGENVFLLCGQEEGMSLGDRVIRFEREAYDPEVSYILTPDGDKLSVSRFSFSNDDRETVADSDLRTGGVYQAGELFIVFDRQSHVHGVDARTGAILWSSSLGRNTDYEGLAEGTGIMVFRGYLLSGDEIREMAARGEAVHQEERWIFLHLEDGKTETAENFVEDCFPGKHCNVVGTAFSGTAMDLSVLVEDKEVWLLRCDLRDRTTRTICLSHKTDKGITRSLPVTAASPDGNYTMCGFLPLEDQESVSLLADWKTGEVTEIRDSPPVDRASLMVWKEDESALAVKGQDDGTVLFSPDGSRLEEFPEEKGKVKDLGFWRGHLFTIEEEDSRVWFRVRQKGISYLLPSEKQDFNDGKAVQDRLPRAMDLPDGKILLRYRKQGFVLDADTGAVEAVIDNMIAYNPDTDTMLLLDNTGDLAFSRRYSWKELAEKGRRILERTGQ